MVDHLGYKMCRTGGPMTCMQINMMFYFLDADSYIIATDGGLYKTNDNGITWSDIENIPVTQFYHVAFNPHNDGLYGGGAQDNGSMSGNSFSF
ncbi:MAG: hypothetical protein IPO32_20815 [Crocinitomicaceae bacterium]|nr:hypothetical protein [Crocinitomicaceae bacterium]